MLEFPHHRYPFIPISLCLQPYPSIPLYPYIPIFLYPYIPIPLYTYIPVFLYPYTPIALYLYTPTSLYPYILIFLCPYSGIQVRHELRRPPRLFYGHTLEVTRHHSPQPSPPHPTCSLRGGWSFTHRLKYSSAAGREGSTALLTSARGALTSASPVRAAAATKSVGGGGEESGGDVTKALSAHVAWVCNPSQLLWMESCQAWLGVGGMGAEAGERWGPTEV